MEIKVINKDNEVIDKLDEIEITNENYYETIENSRQVTKELKCG